MGPREGDDKGRRKSSARGDEGVTLRTVGRTLPPMLPPPRKDGLRLASYNVRKAVGLDRRRDPARILDVIAALDADVVALQEADLRLGPRPSAFDAEEIARRTGLRPLPVSAEGPSMGWHGNAILVREGVLLLDSERLDLPGLEPRGAVLTHLETTEGGLYVVGAHLGLTRRFRRRQADAIRAALAARPEGPAVIMGDFNEWRPVGGLDPLTRGFDLHAPGRSFHASRPLAALDRIAITPQLELRRAGVVQTGAARRASDHLPIWADIVRRVEASKNEG